MKIHVAHSPDSDDAFMFYGLASGKVPSDGFDLEHVLADIETLNRAAFKGRYEITAVSFHAYAHLTDRYVLLPHGASMGDGYGPVDVIKRELGARTIATLSGLLHDSIAFGLDHRDEAVSYAMQFGRGLDQARTDRFVGMYVNGLTLDYGQRGREAVRRLLDDAQKAGL